MTVDYGPDLATKSLHGKQIEVAAARILLENRQTIYVTDDVVKICPHCQRTIQEFGDVPSLQD